MGLLFCCWFLWQKRYSLSSICRCAFSDPKGWIADNPLCGGLQQSPIDIRDEHVVTNPRLGEIFFTGYHDVRAEPLTLSNSGKNGMYNADRAFFHVLRHKVVLKVEHYMSSLVFWKRKDTSCALEIVQLCDKKHSIFLLQLPISCLKWTHQVSWTRGHNL